MSLSKIKKSDLKDPERLAEIRRDVLKAVAEKEKKVKEITTEKMIKNIKPKITKKRVVAKKPRKKKEEEKVATPEKKKGETKTKGVIKKDIIAKEQTPVVITKKPIEAKIEQIKIDDSKKEIIKPIIPEEKTIERVGGIKTIGSEQARQIIQAQQKKVEEKTVQTSFIRKTEEKPAKKTNKIFLILFIVVIFLILLLALLFFIPKTENAITIKASKIISFPALIIGDKTITYNEYLNEVNSVSSYLARQEKRGIITEIPDRNKIKSDVESYFIRQEIVNILARENNVSISQEEIDNEIKNIQQQSRSDQTVDEVLKEIYGWDRKEFEDKVIKPYLLSSKVSKKLFPDLVARDLQKAWEDKIKETEQKVKIYNFIKK